MFSVILSNNIGHLDTFKTTIMVHYYYSLMYTLKVIIDLALHVLTNKKAVYHSVAVQLFYLKSHGVNLLFFSYHSVHKTFSCCWRRNESSEKQITK